MHDIIRLFIISANLIMSERVVDDGAVEEEESPVLPLQKKARRDDDAIDPNERLHLLPPELQTVDFTQRVAWGKYFPYTTDIDTADNNNNNSGSNDDNKDNHETAAADAPQLRLLLPLVPEATAPEFVPNTASAALCHYVHALSGRARAGTIHLKPTPGQQQQQKQGNNSAAATRPIPTPMFMPVGTKGCLKGLSFAELTTDPALQCPIILANTYHLAIQPGTDLVREMGGLHAFQGPSQTLRDDVDALPYNLLTDSGGFQMVSLVELSQVTEEGVAFENPYREGEMLLLRPEDSIRHQNNIHANILMALDDVVSSVTADEDRFWTATHRTLRWYDRCYQAHVNRDTQSLFPIVQGGLDVRLGGLREQCLAGFRYREQELRYCTPGYSIGGLAGGEEKDDFWKVVDQCCRALPDDKPRYLMGCVVGSLQRGYDRLHSLFSFLSHSHIFYTTCVSPLAGTELDIHWTW
jgi:tRNA-guanine family transglycosylase